MSAIKNDGITTDQTRLPLMTLGYDSRSLAIAAADTSEVLVGENTDGVSVSTQNQEILITSSGAVFIKVSANGATAATQENGLFINGPARCYLAAGDGVTVISGDAGTVVSVMARGRLSDG